MKADTYIQMATVKFEMDRNLRAAQERRLARLAPRRSGHGAHGGAMLARPAGWLREVATLFLVAMGMKA